MVVQQQHLLWVVEALDVVPGLGVVVAPVDVLHHVEVVGDVREVAVALHVQHVVEEVHVTKHPASPHLIILRQGGVDHLLHHVSPAVVLDWHDHLVYVLQGEVIIPVIRILSSNKTWSLVSNFSLSKTFALC